jgi:urate oxidase
MKIASDRYGKERVRVLKVLRDGARHEVKEIEVGCMLEGDFSAAYADADNRKVVPTDTIKNTVTVLAHKRLGREIERFGLELCRHFLERYPQVNRVRADIRESRWLRLAPGGRPHDHAFLAGAGTPTARLCCSRGGPEEIESGICDLVVMKSTGSGFSGFPKCEFTTLAETEDRVLATSVQASWTYGALPADFNAANAAIVDAMLRVFAERFSPSVQATLHEMAAAAFKACNEISRVGLFLPNRHYLLANLKPFGCDNANVTFVPTGEPHGRIEAVFDRA